MQMAKLNDKKDDVERTKEMKQKELSVLKDQLVNMETRLKSRTDELKEAEKKITQLQSQLDSLDNQVNYNCSCHVCLWPHLHLDLQIPSHGSHCFVFHFSIRLRFLHFFSLPTPE